MKKIGIIRCMQTEDICPGTTDFSFAAQGKGAFEELGPCEVIGFVSCGGCPGKRAVARARMLVDRGAEAVALASCICKGNPISFPCPHHETMLAAIRKKLGDSVPVLAVFHNEEVGSGTRQGADSTFLTDLLERISENCGKTREDHRAAVAQSFLVSADNAHAVHPNHPEFSDKTEAPVLNGGVVLKYNANQRYTTDGLSAALFARVCREAGAPLQRYSNRPDLPGGSTLGNIAMAHLSVPAVDIGLPQLAMHSACEVAGAKDTGELVKAMTVYFGKSFCRHEDGSVEFA